MLSHPVADNGPTIQQHRCPGTLTFTFRRPLSNLRRGGRFSLKPDHSPSRLQFSCIAASKAESSSQGELHTFFKQSGLAKYKHHEDSQSMSMSFQQGSSKRC